MAEWEIVTAPSLGGDWEIVPNRPNVPEFNKMASPFHAFGAGAYQGIKELPRTAAQIPGAVYGAVTNPKRTLDYVRTPEGQRTTGRLASAGAGALVGAKMGGTIGSVVPGPGTAIGAGLGGAVGAGVGMLGWDKFLQNQGQMPPSEIMEDSYNLGYNTSQGAGLAGLTNVGLKTGRAVASGVASGSKTLARGLRLKALGVRPTDIQNALNKGVTFLDDAGVPTRLDDAVDATNLLEKSADFIDADGFWKRARSNDPKTINIRLQQRVRELADSNSALRDMAQEGLDRMAAKQQVATYRLKPSWEFVEQYITEEVPAHRLKAARRVLKEAKADWQSSGGKIEDLQKFKQKYNRSKVWSGTSGSVDNEIFEVERRIYKGAQQALEKAVDSGLGEIAPEMRGQFKTNNTLMHSYLNFSKPLNYVQAHGRGARSLGEATTDALVVGGAATGGLPQAAATYMLGKEVLRRTPNTLAAPVSRLGNTAQTLSEAAGSLYRPERFSVLGPAATELGRERAEYLRGPIMR